MTAPFRIWAGLAAAALALATQPLAAQDAAEDVTYTIKSDDTLYALARDFLTGPQAARQIAVLNRVRNPRRLQVDRVLRIPRALLRYERVELAVTSFSGPVAINGSAPAIGAVLGEGETVETGRNGFVTFTAAFGGRISLPSNTAARLIRARRYLLGDTLDVDFEVLNGRANANSPGLGGQDSLRIRTPIAVTAVRGTDFRVAYYPQSGSASLTEVIEGAVAVGAGGDEAALAEGFGIAASAEGVGEPEELLSAPGFIGYETMQTGETVNFTIEPVTGAVGYRLQVAADAGFLDIITERVLDTNIVALEGIENGNYSVRARAIAPSGLEGRSEGTQFRRRRLGVEASTGASDDFDGFKFAWRGVGEGTSTYAFQLWDEAAPDTLLVDEVGLEVTELLLGDLAPGRYRWRVAITQPDEEAGLLKVWGPPQTLNVMP